ncbi:hypothetical protein RADP37_00798 [Roseomonas mucosa]|uniref:Uncharacterized protein n=1 Tax=Roseomonas mucosa TaxID=207340 RepID=A0A4Y1MVC4_9PROT|nr:hypothetical protein [Roseomonas mucosa]AWV21549.1 hypothetical protein RADP37_00798 [Roseomonas mucosa]MDT8276306.1 hypothetical protein [Roseomonas mucosa]MDT8355351.1 hypothetical protein [Roseomonas mucosa]MDU7520525.1 hypothetical protein [Roseomonas mucosa]
MTLRTMVAPLSFRAARWPGRRLALPRIDLLALYGAWIGRMEDARRLSEMEPRQARDIGCAAGTERAPETFAADPRPLWGLGLTPMPKASQEMRGKG